MSPEPPLQRADSDVSRQSDSPQPHTPTSTSPSTPSCSSRKTAQVDNVNSHVAHLNKYFEVHDHEDWCEKDFTKWCKKSNNPKFAKGQTVRCYWLNSLKNLAKEGSERAKELLAKSRTKTTEKRKSNDTATTTTTIRHKKKRTTKRGDGGGSVHIQRIHRNTYVSGSGNQVVSGELSGDQVLHPVPRDGALGKDDETPPKKEMCFQVLLPNEAKLDILNLSAAHVKEGLTADALSDYASRSPEVPEIPEEFEKTLSLFLDKNDDSPPRQGEIRDMWCWLRRVEETLEVLGKKLRSPHWNAFLTEGFFDANVWGPIIDSLWLGEPDMILARKEVELLRKDEKRKMDGVIRYGNGDYSFDLGVVEVGKALDRPKSDTKTIVDFQKVTQVMAVMLFDLRRMLCLRKSEDRKALQVIGFVCSGWRCIMIRMWADDDMDTYVMKQKSFPIVVGEGLRPNVRFLRTLVRYRELARRIVNIVSYHSESDL